VHKREKHKSNLNLACNREMRHSVKPFNI